MPLLVEVSETPRATAAHHAKLSEPILRVRLERTYACSTDTLTNQINKVPSTSTDRSPNMSKASQEGSQSLTSKCLCGSKGTISSPSLPHSGLEELPMRKVPAPWAPLAAARKALIYQMSISSGTLEVRWFRICFTKGWVDGWMILDFRSSSKFRKALWPRGSVAKCRCHGHCWDITGFRRCQSSCNFWLDSTSRASEGAVKSLVTNLVWARTQTSAEGCQARMGPMGWVGWCVLTGPMLFGNIRSIIDSYLFLTLTSLRLRQTWQLSQEEMQHVVWMCPDFNRFAHTLRWANASSLAFWTSRTSHSQVSRKPLGQNETLRFLCSSLIHQHQILHPKPKNLRFCSSWILPGRSLASMGRAAVFAALEKSRSSDSGNKATALQQVVLAETRVSQPLGEALVIQHRLR